MGYGITFFIICAISIVVSYCLLNRRLSTELFRGKVLLRALFSSMLIHKNVLITGASQGLGAALAKELSSKGCNLTLVARNRELLVTVKDSLPHKERVHIRSTDVTDAKQCKELFDEICCPDIVICTVGGCIPKLFIDASPEVLQQQMNTNYFSACFIAQQAIRKMRTNGTTTPYHGRRRIIFISSSAALLGITGYSPYSPAKAALRNLADVLRQEYQADNIGIQCAFPSGINSPGYQNEMTTKPEITKMIEEADLLQSCETVSQKVIKGIFKNDFFITSDLNGFLLSIISRGTSPASFISLVVTAPLILIWQVVRIILDRKVRNFVITEN